MSSENMGLLLTHSQELELLNGLNVQDVGSIMTLLDNPQGQQQATPIYNNTFEEITQQQYNEFIQLPNFPPTVPAAVISNEDYEGPYKFEVFIDPHVSKNPWVYSPMLNKLFITRASSFPIDFKWEAHLKNLYVRATPLFSLAQHAQELVTRCIPHTQATFETNRNVPQHIWDHVIRCQSSTAEYFGSKEEKLHLNVLAPLGAPQTGMDTVRLLYMFMCQNSCPTGMNRKPFEVVFTLEDEVGTVYGRRKLNVRVCSCPKRDKEKEEKDYLKDIDSSGAPPPGKRRKTEKVDKKPLIETPSLEIKEYSTQITVCGKHNLHALVKFAHDMMAGELARHGANAQVQKCLDDLGKQLKDLE